MARASRASGAASGGGSRLSTATAVPETRGELEGDEALQTLRRTGRRRLAWASFQRFRAADGFSHARALAFQFTLTLVPALIAVVGLATATDREEVRDFLRETLTGVAPGAVGSLLTEAIVQGSESARGDAGRTALVAGGLAAILAGTLAMAQLERSANRIYGIERDRGPLRRYGLAFLLSCTAGVLIVAALTLVVAGGAIRDAAGWSEGLDLAWAIGRWPIGIGLITGATALLFRRVPRRRQPESSWLALGAALSVVLWIALTGGLALFVDASGNFGATYGPLAGTIAVLLWTFLTSLALLLGLSFAAQLEAVRAGVPEPRVAREANTPETGGPG